ncbi:hypothetical protein [Planococcus donghaensis]|uniref:hypothetical protein n=1 Tax=Planococcus donghaensis TaxID=414778 RepID=UPI0037363CB4
MNINIDSLVTFILMWGIPAAMMGWTYLKMDKADRKSAKEDFKSTPFIFAFGFGAGGIFLIHLGNVLTIDLLKIIGIGFLVIGGLYVTIDLWKTSKIKSILMAALVSYLVFLNLS